MYSGAFFKCYALININIPESVVNVGNSAFYNTKIKSEVVNGLIYFDNWLIDSDVDKMTSRKVNVKNGTVGIAGDAIRKDIDWNCQEMCSPKRPKI